ncbi:junctional adhesion molecule A-like [Stegastes partitus]|uniref:Junctional adhesion molecule A-like n=1 Tax=Stegastes partitus TaxID=144197 RepID=A0A3B5ANQ1_9TELE|nr:PREDICTED: junctional adhesion molecule A-like [Stegastes partitus]
MAVWDKKVLWSFTVLLAGAVAQHVSYPVTSACAVKGSTVTLPCTFTFQKSAVQHGKNVSMKIRRVVWCKNHEICQGPTPSVYDSESKTKHRRFQYLGDMLGNCTLQIRDVRMEDNGTFRFRMEANVENQHFTGKSGVNITVIGVSKMRINSSNHERQIRRGEKVTLQCTSVCSFHQPEITWFKDGHTLQKSGSTLHIDPVIAKDSGNYTCAEIGRQETSSVPYTLQVEEAGKDDYLPLIAGVVPVVLLAVITLILLFFKRKRAAAEDRSDVGGEMEQKHADAIYSNIMPPSEQEEVYDRSQTSQAVEDVSYASFQFKQNKQKRQVREAEDSVVYSSVASRG